jgi:hypothetical protein
MILYPYAIGNGCDVMDRMHSQCARAERWSEFGDETTSIYKCKSRRRANERMRHSFREQVIEPPIILIDKVGASSGAKT